MTEEIENPSDVMKVEREKIYEDPEYLCRLCANTDNQLIPIFDGEGADYNIINKIEQHLPIIKVTRDDELPLNICYLCASNLIAWHNLYEGCKIADSRLRELVNQRLSVKKVDEDASLPEEMYASDSDDDAEYEIMDTNSNDFLDEDISEIVSSDETNENRGKDDLQDKPVPDKTGDVELDELTEEQFASNTRQKGNLKRGNKSALRKGARVISYGNDDHKSKLRTLDEAATMTGRDGLNNVLEPITQLMENEYDVTKKRLKKKVMGREEGSLHSAKRKYQTVTFKLPSKDKSRNGTVESITYKLPTTSSSLQKNETRRELRSADRRSRSVYYEFDSSGDEEEEDVEENIDDENNKKAKTSLNYKETPLKKRPFTTTVESADNVGGKPSKIAKSEYHPFHCDYCTETFRQESSLMRHIRNTHKPKRKSIEIMLDKGRFKIKKKPGRKRLNNNNNSNNSSNKESKKQDPAAEFYICDYCSFSFKWKHDIRKHISKVHMKRSSADIQGLDNNESETHYCFYCNRGFRRTSDMKRHVQMIHIKNPFSGGYKAYCCDICGEGFRGATHMLSHRKGKHDAPELDWEVFSNCHDRVVCCKSCNKYFKSGVFFVSHNCPKMAEKNDAVEVVPPENKKFYCDVCGLRYTWKWVLRLHRENNHPDADPLDWDNLAVGIDPKHICKRCDRAFVNEESLFSHSCVLNTIQQEQQQKEVEEKDEESVKKSKKKRPSDVYFEKKMETQCPYCKEIFTSRPEIVYHIKVDHGIDMDSPFACTVCNKTFKKRYMVDRHNQLYHPTDNNEVENQKILKEAELIINGEVNYNCKICKRNISVAKEYLAHRRAHTTDRKYTCPECGKLTATQNQLNVHVKAVHMKIRDHTCDICGKGFSSKQVMVEHRRIHTGERPFSCEICGKTFISANALVSHKKFHNDYFPHSCPQCPKKFKLRSLLVIHIRSHTGEMPFQCNICLKMFNSSSKYSYHKKVTHSEIRPYLCPTCGSSFKTNRCLKRHMELHSAGHEVKQKRRNPNAGSGRNKSSQSQSQQHQIELSQHSSHSQPPTQQQTSRSSAATSSTVAGVNANQSSQQTTSAGRAAAAADVKPDVTESSNTSTTSVSKDSKNEPVPVSPPIPTNSAAAARMASDFSRYGYAAQDCGNLHQQYVPSDYCIPFFNESYGNLQSRESCINPKYYTNLQARENALPCPPPGSSSKYFNPARPNVVTPDYPSITHAVPERNTGLNYTFSRTSL